MPDSFVKFNELPPFTVENNWLFTGVGLYLFEGLCSKILRCRDALKLDIILKQRRKNANVNGHLSPTGIVLNSLTFKIVCLA